MGVRSSPTPGRLALSLLYICALTSLCHKLLCGNGMAVILTGTIAPWTAAKHCRRGRKQFLLAAY